MLKHRTKPTAGRVIAKRDYQAIWQRFEDEVRALASKAKPAAGQCRAAIGLDTLATLRQRLATQVCMLRG